MVSKFAVNTILANLTIELRDKHHIDVFIETGTLAGETTRWASTHFKKVYTVESRPTTAQNATRSLSDCPNITVVCSDSRQWLPKILSKLEKPAIFWLDAHLTGPTPGDECALRDELQILSQCDIKHFILIDDAGWFVAKKPPAACKDEQWPDFNEIRKILSDWTVELLLHTNVLVAIPKENDDNQVDTMS